MKAEDRKDYDKEGKAKGVYKYWMDELRAAEKREKEKKFQETGDKVVAKYTDEKNESRFNILWANTETHKPTLYAKTPKPVVTRRFKDRNPVAKDAARVLERALEVCIDNYDFDAEIKAAVEDKLLPGRGVCRVRYEPKFKQVPVPLPTDEMGMPVVPDGEEPVMVQGVACCMEDRKVYEEAKVEYHYWKDFRHGAGRKWRQVPWVGFRAYLSRDKLVKRFGKVGNKVKLDTAPDGHDAEKCDDIFKTAEVWEIWDKREGKNIWIAPSYKEGALDEKEATLKLSGGFPCPKPLMAVTTTKSLIPTPYYKVYQDQAKEVDNITRRIDKLVDALKVRGIYAAVAEKIGTMLQGDDNEMVPVDNWQQVMDKGGIRGLVDFFPIEQVANVLVQMYKARDEAKQVLYEITGLSDIMRGATDPGETLGAQKIKGRYTMLRLNDPKAEVENFIRDLLRLKAEIISEHFSAETLTMMTGIEVTDEIMNLLRNDPARNFMIDIETDSTSQVDEADERAQRIEFVSAATGFMERAAPLAEAIPDLKPVLSQMLLFGVRGFHVGRELEDTFDEFLESEGQDNGQAQLQQAMQQLEQMAQQNQELQGQLEQSKAQEAQAKAQEAEINRQKDIEVANIKASAEVDKAIKTAKIKALSDYNIAVAKAQNEAQQEAARLDYENNIKQLELAQGQINSAREETRDMPDVYVNIDNGGNKKIRLEYDGDRPVGGEVVSE